MNEPNLDQINNIETKEETATYLKNNVKRNVSLQEFNNSFTLPTTQTSKHPMYSNMVQLLTNLSSTHQKNKYIADKNADGINEMDNKFIKHQFKTP